MEKQNKYLYIYLVIVFGIWWAGIFVITSHRESLTPLIGKMSLTHPLVIFFTYLPTIAGILVYFLAGGAPAVKKLLLKAIPRKKDLFWFPVLFGVAVIFVLSMRYGSLLFGVNVPKITYSFQQMFVTAILNFVKETALIGGVFGWVGFLLPFIQGKLKNSTLSGLLTGLIFGLWVLPMPYLLGATVNISYLLYLAQLMSFFVFTSYIFNLTKGTLSFYLFMFWLVATGAHIQMYYFNTDVQAMELAFFALLSVIMFVVIKRAKPHYDLQTFPDYIRV